MLDYLPCDACLETPDPDQEVLCSLCRRLDRDVAVKGVERKVFVVRSPAAPPAEPVEISASEPQPVEAAAEVEAAPEAEAPEARPEEPVEAPAEPPAEADPEPVAPVAEEPVEPEVPELPMPQAPARAEAPEARPRIRITVASLAGKLVRRRPKGEDDGAVTEIIVEPIDETPEEDPTPVDAETPPQADESGSGEAARDVDVEEPAPTGANEKAEPELLALLTVTEHREGKESKLPRRLRDYAGPVTEVIVEPVEAPPAAEPEPAAAPAPVGETAEAPVEPEAETEAEAPQEEGPPAEAEPEVAAESDAPAEDPEAAPAEQALDTEPEDDWDEVEDEWGFSDGAPEDAFGIAPASTSGQAEASPAAPATVDAPGAQEADEDEGFTFRPPEPAAAEAEPAEEPVAPEAQPEPAVEEETEDDVAFAPPTETPAEATEEPADDTAWAPPAAEEAENEAHAESEDLEVDPREEEPWPDQAAEDGEDPWSRPTPDDVSEPGSTWDVAGLTDEEPILETEVQEEAEDAPADADADVPTGEPMQAHEEPDAEEEEVLETEVLELEVLDEESEAAEDAPVAEPEPAEEPVSPSSSDEEAVTRLQGVGETYGERLRDAGCERFSDLVGLDPWDLADRTGISARLVERWIHTAELVKGAGVPMAYADALVRAGHKGLEAFANAEPADAARALNDVLRDADSSEAPVSAEQVEEWQRRAR